MAEFVMHCPYCGEGLTVQEEWLGMEGECPGCGKTFPVAKDAPEPPVEAELLPDVPPALTPLRSSGLAPAVPSEASARPFTFVCPSCATQVELPGVMLGKPYTCAACAEEAVAMPATEKKCPFCGETIKFQATVCKHCRKHLSAPAPAAGAVGGVPQLQPLQPGMASRQLQPLQPGMASGQLQPLQPGMAPGATPYGQPDVPQGAAPYGQPAHYGLSSFQYPVPPWTLTEAEAKSIETMTTCYWVGLLAGLVTFGLGFWLSIVCHYILLYKYWKLVPPQEAETTPGKAVVFLFIPFFNLYWIFIAFWKLSRHYDRFAPAGETPSDRAMWSLILTLLCCVPFLGILCSILAIISWIFWFLQMKKIALSLPRVG